MDIANELQIEDILKSLREQIGFEKIENRLKHGQARTSHVTTGFLQPLGQFRINKGEKHDPRGRLDLRYRAIELGAAAHEGKDMLDRGDALILSRDRPARRNERFARGVRHEVKMKIAASQNRPPWLSTDARGLWIAVDEWAPESDRGAQCPERGFFSTALARGRGNRQ